MATFKFALDNQQLTGKMWYKVVESGQIGRVRGSQELKTRSRWKTDPRARRTARIARV